MMEETGVRLVTPSFRNGHAGEQLIGVCVDGEGPERRLDAAAVVMLLTLLMMRRVVTSVVQIGERQLSQFLLNRLVVHLRKVQHIAQIVNWSLFHTRMPNILRCVRVRVLLSRTEHRRCRRDIIP